MALWETYQTQVPEGQLEEYRVEKYEIKGDEPGLWIVNLKSPGRAIPPGTYTKLMRGGTLVMSDTPAEVQDLYPLRAYAEGHVLINGLGLGVATEMCMQKEGVEHVTVVEISQAVIRLVGLYLKLIYGDKLTIIHADAFEYQPPKGIRYGAVWHDIWDNICADNLPDMHRLHRKYGRRTSWQGSWCRAICELHRDRENNSYW